MDEVIQKFDYWVIGDAEKGHYYEFMMEGRTYPVRLTPHDFQACRFYSFANARTFLTEHRKLLPGMKVIGMRTPVVKNDYGRVVHRK